VEGSTRERNEPKAQSRSSVIPQRPQSQQWQARHLSGLGHIIMNLVLPRGRYEHFIPTQPDMTLRALNSYEGSPPGALTNGHASDQVIQEFGIPQLIAG